MVVSVSWVVRKRKPNACPAPRWTLSLKGLAHSSTNHEPPFTNHYFFFSYFTSAGSSSRAKRFALRFFQPSL